MPTCDLVEQIITALPRTSRCSAPLNFSVIPSKGTARWLLPADGRHSSSVLASWSPYCLSSRIKWSAVRAASRVGILGSLPQVTKLELGQTAAIDWRDLGWTGEHPPQPVVYVGTPGESRKAVIHLVDSASGECKAVVKVPLAAGSKDAIVREGNVLRAIALQDFSCAPRLLQIDEDRGLTTQEFLPGKPGGRRFLPAYWDLLRSLRLDGEQTSIVEYAALWQEELPFADVPKSDCAQVSSALVELSDARSLPAFWVHGDFAPWNIKHRIDRTLALLDWEEAQWRGLPLYDAYHFLHMQDFVFGSKATSHRRNLEPFAKSLGLDPQQTRKLEIAYLSHAYMQSVSQKQYKRRDFVLRTLALALRERPAFVALPEKPRGKLQLVTTPLVNAPNLRTELFSTLMTQLNSLQIPYCVLSGYQDSWDESSDLDIMMRPADLRHLPTLLAQTAHTAGGLLVQAMQHETTACHFVMATADEHIGYLDPDCCGHYRRNGRTWLLAEVVLASRRKHKGFYLPSVANEFIYYLLKKVLKQSIQAHHLKRLQHLYVRNTAECRDKIARFFDRPTATLLQRALVEQDLYWFQTHLPALLVELRKSAPAEPVWRRITETWRDAGRLLRRVVCPTGIVLSIVGGEAEQRSAIADEMRRDLAPAFRDTSRVQAGANLPKTLLAAAGAWLARIRSTLVISAGPSNPEPRGWRRSLQRFHTMLDGLLLRPDVVIALRTQKCQPRGSVGRFLAAPYKQRQIPNRLHLDARMPQEQLAREATGVVLQWLAARLDTRMKWSSSRSDAAIRRESLRSLRACKPWKAID